MSKQTPLNRVPAGSARYHQVARAFLAVLGARLTGVFLYTRGRRAKSRHWLTGLALSLSLVTAIGFGLAKPAVTAAATSNTVNFQARLESSSGAIAPDGNYNVEFKLYYASGGALWTEDYLNSASQGIRVANGYLTANLGSITAFPSSIDWSQQLYLGMNIGGNGPSASWDGEMTPRLQLTAVPYAFKAAQANQLATTNGSYTSTLSLLGPTSGNQTFQIQDQGAAGTYNLCVVGSSSCGFAASSGNGNYIQNATSLQTGANFNIDGTGKAAYLNAATALQTAGVTRLDASGNLTAATGNFTGKVTAAGVVSKTSSMWAFEGLPSSGLAVNGVEPLLSGGVDGSNNSADLSLQMTAANHATDIIFSSWTGSAYTEKLRITAAGAVGIGTSLPAYQLDVRSSTSASQLHFNGSASDDGGYLLGLNQYAYLSGGTAFNGSSWIAKDSTASILGIGSGGLALYGNSGLTAGGSYTPTQLFGVTSAGNVGIGVSAPTYKLQVAGSAQATTLYQGSNQVCDTSGNCSVGAGSGNYIQNGTGLQAGANFNIDGTGTAATLNATTALQTGGVTRIDAAGNITAGTGTFSGALTATALNLGNSNFSFYKDSNDLIYGDALGQTLVSSATNADLLQNAYILGGTEYRYSNAAASRLSDSGGALTFYSVGAGSGAITWTGNQKLTVSAAGDITNTGVLTVQGTGASTIAGTLQFQNSLSANGKQFLVTNDNYLRINQGSQFSSGIWLGTSPLRAGYGGVYLGSSGSDGQIALLSTTGDTTRRITLSGGTGNVAATSFTQSGNNVCDASGNCGVVSGSNNYIQNQNASPQSANFWISGSGSVGGHLNVGTSTNNATLDVNGSSVNEGNVYDYHNLASLNNGSSPVTSTMAIGLPQAPANTLATVVISGTDYQTGAWQLTLSGQILSTSFTINSATLSGNAPFSTVRTAVSGGKPVILIGTTATSWSYIQAEVADFSAGYSTLTGWGSGWTMALVASESAYSSISSPTTVSSILTTTSGNQAQVFLQGGNSFGTVTELGTKDNNSLLFLTNNTTRLSLDTSGNAILTGNLTVQGTGNSTFVGKVGIGISNPTYNLDVQGVVGARIQTTTNTTTALLVQNAGGVNVLGVDTANNKLSVNGNVLVNSTTNSTTGFMVQSADGYQVFDIDTSNKRVGILTTTPGYTLTVNGSIQGGTIYQGSHQVCDNSGNCIAGAGSNYYIQNQTAVAQGASFNISGSGTIGANLYSGNIDTTTGGGTLNVGGTRAAVLNIGGGALTETLNIGNSTGPDTVNIATGGGSDTVNLGSPTATTTLQGGIAKETLGSTGVLIKSNTNSTTAMQVQDTAGNTALDVDTTNGRVGIGTVSPSTLLDVAGGSSSYAATYHAAAYSCNSGDSLSGTTCTNVTTYAATYNGYYYCNSGDTLSGTTCNHATGTYAASYYGYYYCPSGGSLSGTTCTNTYSASYQSGYYYCSGSDTLSGTTCYSYGSYAATATANQCGQGGLYNSGDNNCYYFSGTPPCTPPYYAFNNTCVENLGQSQVWYSYSCPSGGSLSGTTCYTTTTYNAYYQSGYYYCPSGGSLSGTTCTNTYTATYTGYYYCNGTDVLSGTTCTSYSTYPASYTGSYSCNSGDTLSGTTCTHTTTYTATYTAAYYSCNPGDVLSGTTCTIIDVSALIEGSASIGNTSPLPLNYTRPAVTGGALSFATYASYGTSIGTPYGVATADFNGDGKPDVVVAGTGSTVISVMLNSGSGVFGTPTTYSTGSSAYSVATADVNGDGKPDIIVGDYSSNNIGVFINTTTGSTLSFAAQVTYASVNGPRFITTADLNGDGCPDIIATRTSATGVSIFLNKCNGTGAFNNQTGATVGSTPYSIAVADVNNDSKLDLVVANEASNNVSVLLGNGDGTFATATNFTVGTSPFAVVTADLNGDGKPDIVTANYSSANVSVLLNNGTGTGLSFATQTTTATSYNQPDALAVADFNGDGKPDIVYGSGNSYNAVGVLVGNGSGGFTQSNFGVGYYYQYALATTDFNGDGKPDIVAVDSNYNTVSVLLNTTTFPVASASFNGTLSVQALSASAAGLIIQGVTSQVADLLHIQLAAGRSEQPGNTLLGSNVPNSSTASYTMGYSFTPNVNGSITQLGVRCVASGNYTLQLWTSGGTLLATATGTASGQSAWSYYSITPVNVTAGTTYVVSEYSASGYYCYQSLTMPVTTSDITINTSWLNANNGDTFPSNSSNTSTMYGEADITFVSNAPGTALAVTAAGNVGIGVANPNNALSVAGNIAATGTITGGVASPDYAENITASDPSINAADVVTMDPNHPGQVIKASTPYDSRVMGVVSTHPGFITNADISTVEGGSADTSQRPLALSGRVPVKVSTENGPIKLGDYLTTSDIPGYAMKATGSGAVIGVAMADFDGTEDGNTACGDSGQYQCGSVMFFINPSATNPAADANVMQGGDAVLNSMTVNGALAADSINVGGMASVNGLQVLGDASIGGNLAVGGDLTVAGTAHVANLVVDNHIISQGDIPIITVGPAGGQDGQVSIDGTDTAGTLTVTVKAHQPTAQEAADGMKPELLAAGALANINFAQSFSVTPRVVLSPDNSASVGFPVYTVKTSNGYQVVITQAASDGTTYQFDYVVIGSNGVAASSP